MLDAMKLLNIEELTSPALAEHCPATAQYCPLAQQMPPQGELPAWHWMLGLLVVAGVTVVVTGTACALADPIKELYVDT